ncbi:tetraspanin-33-like [Dreissena polymorpha]|uniref:Tetraspanin n=1 Tax=Dreissena polymorpha TaxID=45954 RepID=A0A9D4KKY5_DREPO|nr:tetraspanin-33-like [Dreissena polymorpha]KAH3841369.1 hypothetical protein DPMN_114828 [Dreissena polymorpha]
MGCCPKGDTLVSPVVKYVLLVGTLIHWICGAGMLALGIWAYVEKNKVFYHAVQNVYDVIFDLSIVLMTFGAVMFVITMCGFVGALRENTILLKIFYWSLAVIFVVEVVGGSLVLIFKDRAVGHLSGVLKEVYVRDYQDDQEGIMDYFQEKFACCGVDGYKDWNKNAYFNCSGRNPSRIKCAVPYSCCKKPDEMMPGLHNILCGASVLSQNASSVKVYTVGCVPTVVAWLHSNMLIIGAIAIAIAVPQLLGICLGKLLVNQIEDQRSRYFMHRNVRGRARSRVEGDIELPNKFRLYTDAAKAHVNKAFQNVRDWRGNYDRRWRE